MNSDIQTEGNGIFLRYLGTRPKSGNRYVKWGSTDIPSQPKKQNGAYFGKDVTIRRQNDMCWYLTSPSIAEKRLLMVQDVFDVFCVEWMNGGTTRHRTKKEESAFIEGFRETYLGFLAPDLVHIVKIVNELELKHNPPQGKSEQSNQSIVPTANIIN